MAFLDVAQEGQVGGVPSCMYLLAALGAVVLALTGALVKMAKLAWEERMERVTLLSELRVMGQALKERKGVSPP